MGRGATKNQYVEGNCLKRGPWIVYRFKVDLAKKREGLFLRGWEGSYPDVHYVCEFFSTSCKDFPDKTGRIPPTEHILAWFKISANLLLLRNFRQLLKKCMNSRNMRIRHVWNFRNMYWCVFCFAYGVKFCYWARNGWQKCLFGLKSFIINNWITQPTKLE